MHTKTKQEVLTQLNVEPNWGLKAEEIAPRREKYGSNSFARAKKKPLFLRVLGAFCEPMLLILCFALAVTLGVQLGKFFRTGDGDFIECAGIFAAVIISVTITVAMEGRSERAFEMLGRLSDKAVVKVRRDGEIRIIPQSEAVVGDIIVLESGCKVVADGRLIKAENLSADESTLTGESKPRNKRADAFVKENAPLAERINCVYSGTLIASGSGEMVVTAVGDNAELGKIAGELRTKNRISAPLDEKLSRLSKAVTAIGGISAALVFIISAVRLFIAGTATFENLQEIFTESIVLIVAAVPEGLPTIVAISLSLNVMKLARENALIKKLVVAETSGCVSVICSDKTGTLTQNKMAVEAVCTASGKEVCTAGTGSISAGGEGSALPDIIYENIVANTVAEAAYVRGSYIFSGSPTECALLGFAIKDARNLPSERAKFSVTEREEFTSEKKYSSAKTRKNVGFRTYYKGSFEKISALCGMTDEARESAQKSMSEYSRRARRVIAFAHSDGGRTVFDGFAALTDPVRPDVKRSVALCKEAGIKVKILTGDNAETAFAVARELGIASTRSEVVSGTDVERMTDAEFKRRLPQIAVIARSTPLIKLRAVNLLKEMGEVVAVTGDGINDAPAIKQADIGIAMGSGSEIAKEAGDVILLDDSFATIVKAISFGRNVYCNFQRFIMFQLSVNFSAVMIVLACLFAGLKSPFSSLQLLWINIIMDGPPALTLGFEAASDRLMRDPPKKRSENLVSKKTAARIIVHSAYMAGLVILQGMYNFLGASPVQTGTVMFTMFVMMQLFNAFNCRQVGSESIFPTFFKNKLMLLSFGAVLVVQVIITQFGGSLFGTVPLDIGLWLKITALAATVPLLSELVKFAYRAIRYERGHRSKRSAAGFLRA